MTTIIGLDCATREAKMAVARGSLVSGTVSVNEILIGSAHSFLIDPIMRWITASQRVLLAFDAPLGWPAGLAEALIRHRAGDPIRQQPHTLFRRYTDQVVRKRLGKQPLDVGADRIARTALSALIFLKELRQRTGKKIPLAWSEKFPGRIAAIEVYPAGTLAAYHQSSTGYKGKKGKKAREKLIYFINREIDIEIDHGILFENDHALDAALCVLAGADFGRGACIQPDDRSLAKKEGWIWVRKPE